MTECSKEELVVEVDLWEMNKHTHVYTHFYFLSLPLTLSHTFTEAAKEIYNDNKIKTHASSHTHFLSNTHTRDR